PRRWLEEGRVINDGPGSAPAVMCPTAPKQVSEGSETTLQAGVKQPIQAAMVPAGAVKQYLRERRAWLAAARRLASVRPRQGKRQPVSGRSQAARALDGRSGTACFEPHLRSVAVSLRRGRYPGWQPGRRQLLPAHSYAG